MHCLGKEFKYHCNTTTISCFMVQRLPRNQNKNVSQHSAIVYHEETNNTKDTQVALLLNYTKIKIIKNQYLLLIIILRERSHFLSKPRHSKNVNLHRKLSSPVMCNTAKLICSKSFCVQFNQTPIKTFRS